MKRAVLFCLILIFSLYPNVARSLEKIEKKVILCGVCRNVEHAVDNTIKNIEAIGNCFSQYAVIIYENNSTDNTAALFNQWAINNPRVTFITEYLTDQQQPSARTEKIARARNIVLSLIQSIQYDDFDYVIMADLDFKTLWPKNDIIKTIKSSKEWDCVCAHGYYLGLHADRYAYRDQKLPLGPEILGDFFWHDLNRTHFSLEGEEYQPVYSAFGGLAIYKKSSISGCSYSGIVTEDLKKYYERILAEIPHTNFQRLKYLELNKLPFISKFSSLPIIFRENTANEHPTPYPVTCCEHVPFHASMAVHGFGKIFVNPQMRMYY